MPSVGPLKIIGLGVSYNYVCLVLEVAKGGAFREWAALRPVYIKLTTRIFCFRGCPSSVLWGGPRLDIAPPPHRRVILALPYKLNNPAPSDASDRALMLMLLLVLMMMTLCHNKQAKCKRGSTSHSEGARRRMGSSVLLRTRGGVQKQRTLHPRGVP